MHRIDCKTGVLWHIMFDGGDGLTRQRLDCSGELEGVAADDRGGISKDNLDVGRGLGDGGDEGGDGCRDGFFGSDGLYVEDLDGDQSIVLGVEVPVVDQELW